MRKLQKDRLEIRVYETRDEMGKAAASDCAACILELAHTKAEINVVFAAAPSQNEFLKHLRADSRIPWGKINALHMDEYVGIAKGAPQSFAAFLKNAIFDKVPFRSVQLIDCTCQPEEECARYAEILKKFPPDIVCMGIGENGHIAFNDPHVADFRDPELIKKVSLDDTCRMQQVHDGCFAAIGDVPRFALTLTVPALTAAEHIFCVVPVATKAAAVARTASGEIGESCPATVLRTHGNAIMYCDEDSGAGI